MPSAVTVEHLEKRYGSRRVVDDLSFEVPAGHVLALLGPNGAGKTTTVECIAGLRAPDAGAVRVLDADPRTERARVMDVLGMMLQEGGVHRGATPRELLRLFAALHRRPLAPVTLIDRLGLGACADTRTRTLSVGQRQRVSLALALIGRPRVAVLDEPTAGLDPAARRNVWALIDELREDGVGVLLTTHGIAEAEHLADTVAVIDHGQLVALDTPRGLTTRHGLVVRTPAAVDARALSTALGASVAEEAPGRWLVDVGPERINDVTGWFVDQGLPMTGVAIADSSLEDVYLRLTEPAGERDDGSGREAG